MCVPSLAEAAASLADLGVVLEGVAGDGKTLLEALSAAREGRGFPSLRLLGLDAEEIPENAETSGASPHIIHTPFLLYSGVDSLYCILSWVLGERGPFTAPYEGFGLQTLHVLGLDAEEIPENADLG
jgi:hypothetical protein